MQKWIKQNKDTDTLYFPPYTPELNPQEHIWKAGRRATAHNRYITDIQTAAEQLTQHITGRAFDYELLRSQI